MTVLPPDILFQFVLLALMDEVVATALPLLYFTGMLSSTSMLALASIPSSPSPPLLQYCTHANPKWVVTAISSIPFLSSPPHAKLKTLTKNKTMTTWETLDKIAAFSGENLVVVQESAAEIVGKFYEGINRRDLDSVQNLIADNCVYEDLIFPQPFVGRKDILQFFKKFTDSTSTELQFVIDEISREDSASVGVVWHLEWKGKPFPFSKGCSYYRLEVVNGKRQIVYGRDSVEPAIKPGEAALAAIRSVIWLLEQFPNLGDRL